MADDNLNYSKHYLITLLNTDLEVKNKLRDVLGIREIERRISSMENKINKLERDVSDLKSRFSGTSSSSSMGI